MLRFNDYFLQWESLHPEQPQQQSPDFFAFKCLLIRNFTTKIISMIKITLTIAVPIVIYQKV